VRWEKNTDRKWAKKGEGELDVQKGNKQSSKKKWGGERREVEK